MSPGTLSPEHVSLRWSRVLRFMVKQTCFGVLLLVLFGLWLQIPDASVLDVLGSVLFGLALLLLAGCGETWLLKRLARQHLTRRAALMGTGLWLAAALLWWLWSMWMSHFDGQSYLYASFLNSKLSHGLRVVFSYSRFFALLHWLWTTLAWCAGGVLSLAVSVFLLCPRPIHSVGKVLRSPFWWTSLVLAADTAVYVTSALMNWLPGHTLGVEFSSLSLRLFLSVLLDGALACGLLVLIVVLTGCAAAPPEPPGELLP